MPWEAWGFETNLAGPVPIDDDDDDEVRVRGGDVTVAMFGGVGRCERSLRSGHARQPPTSGIYAVVGTRTAQFRSTQPGMPTVLPWQWRSGAKRLRIDGCIDHRMRAAFGACCEYDGRLSAVRYGTRTLLFSRANLAECQERGGRWVQVASTLNGPSPLGSWGRWRMLEMAEYTPASGDVYFFAVRSPPASHSRPPSPSPNTPASANLTHL